MSGFCASIVLAFILGVELFDYVGGRKPNGGYGLKMEEGGIKPSGRYVCIFMCVCMRMCAYGSVLDCLVLSILSVIRCIWIWQMNPLVSHLRANFNSCGSFGITGNWMKSLKGLYSKR